MEEDKEIGRFNLMLYSSEQTKYQIAPAPFYLRNLSQILGNTKRGLEMLDKIDVAARE